MRRWQKRTEKLQREGSESTDAASLKQEQIGDREEKKKRKQKRKRKRTEEVETRERMRRE